MLMETLPLRLGGHTYEVVQLRMQLHNLEAVLTRGIASHRRSTNCLRINRRWSVHAFLHLSLRQRVAGTLARPPGGQRGRIRPRHPECFGSESRNRVVKTALRASISD